MCGIAGIATWKSSGDLYPELKRMSDTIAHRGPDDWGAWTDSAQGIGLAQRRLSIIDLSPHGHQPMLSASGRWIISFNGEIYNSADLRSELNDCGKAPSWRGHSDTEVLLGCIDAWGVEKTVARAVGMFAISLWDRKNDKLILARDRIGEKPLYYGNIGGRLLFGSELKSISAVAGSNLEIDREALHSFFRFGYLPGPRSIWKRVKKLRPGHWLELSRPEDADLSPFSYWDVDRQDQQGFSQQFVTGTDADVISFVEERLTEAVRLQMVADVPVGAFLSGGVDSSVIVALMQKQSHAPVRTFTIGFENQAFDEAPFAEAIAKRLGTDHTELYITGREAEELVPDLASIYDEPFADSSQIPTILLSHLAKQRVKVSLSGDGGDELFAGYPRYFLTSDLWRNATLLPRIVRRMGSRLLRMPTVQSWDALISLLPGTPGASVNGRRLHKLAQLLSSETVGEMYLRVVSQFQEAENPVLGLDPPSLDSFLLRKSLEPVYAMRRWDLEHYLPDDLLVKVDRASMSVGLESRSPLLDHRVVELAFTLPDKFLRRNGVDKWILRQVLFRHLPPEMFSRPKSGFSVPLADWLRGSLKTWAEDLLSSDLLKRGDLLDPAQIRALWTEHLTGKADRSSPLWSVLMFLAWSDINLRK